MNQQTDDRLPDRQLNKFFAFLRRMSTLECIRYLTIIFIIGKVIAIFFNISVLIFTYSIELKTNLRLFLSVFTLLTFLQTVIFYIKNKQYFSINRLPDIQDTNEIGLLGNFIDGLILFWCFAGYHMITETKANRVLNPWLYYTCLFWSFVGTFIILSPLLAIIILLLVVTYFKPKLPVVKYDKQNLNQDCCNICLVEYSKDDDIKILPCKHNYHQSCIDDWFSVDDICPTCRKPVNILFDLIDGEN